MGSEFLKKTKNSIRKVVAQSRAALATPDLLTTIPSVRPRSYIATPSGPVSFTEGAKVLVESDGSAVRLRQGNSYVAKLDNPPKDIVTAVAASGSAGATVERVMSLSGKIEVSLW